MKRRFVFLLVLGIWMILCAPACGKEELAEEERAAAGEGVVSLAGDFISGSKDNGTKVSGEDGSAAEGEDGSGRNGESSKGEEGSGRGGEGSQGEDGSGRGGEGSQGEEGPGRGGEGSQGEGGSGRGGEGSQGEDGPGRGGEGSQGEGGSGKSGEGSQGEGGSGKKDAASQGEGGLKNPDGMLSAGNERPIQTAAVGALSVEGTKLVDGSGNGVQLRGISTHGLAWYPDYVNEDCVRQLKEEWGMNVFRLAMYTAEYGGYCSGGNQEDLKALVKKGVEYATDNDMYVIIDWHILSDGNPNTYLEDAKGFFKEMSEEYADYTNVLYEICNEPNGGTTWSDVKSYAEEVIGVIRENDEDGIILVGTPNWSQYVEQAAEDPIDDYDNIMYTLHFYAATHKEDLRQAMVRAVEAGLPVFVSEYGICDASGSGGIDEYQANQWVELLNQYQISYVAWNLSNKSETSAVIKSSCGKVSGFTQEDLSDSGKWLYGMLGAQGSLGTDSGGADSGAAGSGAGGQQGTDQGAAGSGAGGQQGTDQGTAGSNAGGQGGTLAQGELSLSVQPVNSWGQGSESFYQYTLTITNLGEADVEGWTVQIAFNGDISLSNGWNGNYQVNGSTLIISSMDYNGHIGKGGSADNVGFILQGQEGLALIDG